MNNFNFFNSVKIAFNSLKRNSGRSALTVLGIVIGIASVITVMSVGRAAENSIFAQLESFGTNIVEVEVKVPSASKTSTDNALGIAMGIEITTLTLDDQAAIEKLSNVTNSYAMLLSQQITSFRGENKQIILFGTSPSFLQIDKTGIAEGRFFNEEENNGLANVAVIGSKVKEKVFGDKEFLGQSIRIGKQKFTVIGLMRERGATFGFDMDDMVYLPIKTLQKKIMGINHVTAIMTQVANNDLADVTADEITNLLRERHDIDSPDKDDFAVTPFTEALAILDSIFWAVSLLLIAVSGVSLVVGGVGIMNIMYVSVLERTYEIGLRKALGASSKNILWQFLWEAIIVTFFGAILGVIFGIIFSLVIALVASGLGMSWEFTISIYSLFLASGVSIAIGLAFGIFPARSAAKMNPITALRYNK